MVLDLLILLIYLR